MQIFYIPPEDKPSTKRHWPDQVEYVLHSDYLVLQEKCAELTQRAAELGDEILTLRTMVNCEDMCEHLTFEQNSYTHQCSAAEGKTLKTNYNGEPLRCAECPLWTDTEA